MPSQSKRATANSEQRTNVLGLQEPPGLIGASHEPVWPWSSLLLPLLSSPEPAPFLCVLLIFKANYKLTWTGCWELSH